MRSVMKGEIRFWISSCIRVYIMLFQWGKLRREDFKIFIRSSFCSHFVKFYILVVHISRCRGRWLCIKLKHMIRLRWDPTYWQHRGCRAIYRNYYVITHYIRSNIFASVGQNYVVPICVFFVYSWDLQLNQILCLNPFILLEVHNIISSLSELAFKMICSFIM